MTNIQDFRQLYRRKVTALSDGSSKIRLTLDRVDHGILRVLTHVTVENQDSAYTKCRLGIAHGKVDHYIDELENPAAGELAVSRSDILLMESDRLFAELTGTTSGDLMIMICIGWEMDMRRKA
ncbi:MAG: hypothetical protein DRJ03_19715 [Chloroflexi bacterium]|nr:MAG: hypothetical protein DRJ03_19715 [Chloroflexota bacterium]